MNPLIHSISFFSSSTFHANPTWKTELNSNKIQLALAPNDAAMLTGVFSMPHKYDYDILIMFGIFQISPQKREIAEWKFDTLDENR